MSTPSQPTEEEKTPWFFRPFTTTLVIIVVLLAFMYFVEWDTNRNHVDVWFQTVSGETNSVLKLDAPLNEARAKERLQEQADFIAARISFYKETMKYFYGTYYSTIILASVCSGIAALLFACISLKGWKDPDPRLAQAFFVASAFAAVFWVCPKMLRQEQNAEANKVLYLNFVKLLEETRTIAATGSITTTNGLTHLDLTNAIWHVHARITNTLSLAVVFDPSARPDFSSVRRGEN